MSHNRPNPYARSMDKEATDWYTGSLMTFWRKPRTLMVN